MAMTSVEQVRSSVTVGVDTHADVHVAAAVDALGRFLGAGSFPTTAAGYGALLRWAQEFGAVERFGVEGTGAYGAGLARFLAARGQAVVEVDRPDRRTRRQRGKSDPVDAEAAARAVLAGTASGVPKARDGAVEMIRTLRVARSGALKGRTQAANQLHSLVTTAPEELRARLRRLGLAELVRACAALRPPGRLTGPVDACKLALRRIARRHQALSAEVAELDVALEALTEAAAPELVAVYGVGVEVAGQLLVTVGDNPERLRSEASFARLCGVAPLPASSGRTQRHRLDPRGDRHAHHALWRVAITRMAHDRRTRAYVERRTEEGLSKEIIRCLKRSIAREVYRVLTRPPAPRPAT